MSESANGTIRLKVTADTKEVAGGAKTVEVKYEQLGQSVLQILNKISKSIEQLNVKFNESAGNIANSLSGARKQTDGMGVSVDSLNTKMSNAWNSTEKLGKLSQALKFQLDSLVSGEKTPKSVLSMETELSKTDEGVKKLDDEFKKLSIEYDELSEKGKIGRGLFSLSAKDQTRLEELDRLLAKNGTETDTLKKKSAELRAQLEKIKLNPAASSEAEALKSKIGSIDQRMKQLNSSSLPKLSSIGSSAFKNVRSVAQKSLDLMKSRLKSLAAPLQNATKGITKFSDRAWRLAKGALIFSAITMAFTAIRQGIAGLISSSSKLSNLLAQIKGNLLNGFAPIWDAIQPAIETLFNQFVKVTEIFAKFSTMIFGASNSAQTIADSFSDTSKSSKDITSSLDELNVIGDTKKTVNPISNLTGDIQEGEGLFTTLWKTFSESWQTYGARVTESAGNAFDALKRNVSAVKDSLLTVFQDTKLPDSIFIGLSNILDLIAAISTSFTEAWTSADRGTHILSNIDGVITGIVDTVSNLAKGLKDAWKENDIGTQIMTNLLAIIGTVTYYMSLIQQSIANWAGTLDFGPLLVAFNILLGAIHPVVSIIMSGLLWCYNNVLLPLGKWTIEKALPALINALAGAFNFLYSVLSALAPVGVSIWDNFLSPLLSFTGDAIVWTLYAVADAFNWLGEVIAKHSTAFQNMIYLILSLWVAFNGYAIMKLVQSAFETLALKGLFLIDAIRKMPAAINAFLTSAKAMYAGIALIASALIYWIANWDKIKEGISDLSPFQALAAILYTVAAAWATYWVAQTMGTGAAMILAGLAALGLGMFLSAKGSKATSSNASSLSASSYADIGGGAVSVPALAEGSVIPGGSEFIAILGDQPKGQTNIEAPLDTIKQAVDEVLSAKGNNTDGITVPIVLELDGNTLFKALKKVQRARGFDYSTGMGAFAR